MIFFLDLLIPMTANDVNGIADWGTEVVGDMMPLIIIVLGIGIGIWVVNAFIRNK